MLYGPPASGKSVFLDVVGSLLGQENVARVTLQGLSGRFNTAELYGRAANICADIDATKITETGTFKLTSVNDEIQAERKNKDPFRFVSFATQFYSANTIPTSEDRTGAWTRRWALLHFPNPRPVEKRVLGYQDVLLQEAEGIIAKAVRMIESVLIQKDYSLIAEDQAEFERKTNYIIQFIEDELIKGDLNDENCFTATQEAQWRYEKWAKDEGYDHPASWKKVAETLTQQGFKSVQKRLPSGKARVWRGFTLQHRAPQQASAIDPYDER
jgi:putative DNA primase/helicase